MKKFETFSLFLVFFFVISYLASAADFQGNSRKYQIKAIEIPDMELSVEKVWNITYDGCETPVTVKKRNLDDGAVYLVSTEYFEVCYSCNQKGFGTGKIKNSWRCIPLEINEAVINSGAVNQQKVITPHPVDDATALDLIASYLPDLLNDQYAHLLN